MNPEAQTKLEEILKKDISAWNAEEKAFVVARRSYLNDEQTKRCASVLKGASKVEQTDEDADDLDGMSAKDLKALAGELGLPKSGKADDLRDAIRAKRAEGDDQE